MRTVLILVMISGVNLFVVRNNARSKTLLHTCPTTMQCSILFHQGHGDKVVKLPEISSIGYFPLKYRKSH